MNTESEKLVLSGTGAPESTKPRIDRDDPRLWVLGGIYYNPADPCILVDERHGAGYTLNFARHEAWAIAAAFFVPAIYVIVRKLIF